MHSTRFDSQSRRAFLQNAGLGCGSLALSSLLAQGATNPLAPKPAQFTPKAKAIIWLFMTGSPSQVDTFDYKPDLQKRDGQKLDGADPKTGFFTTSGKCLKSPFKFKQHGESGTWVSEIFPNVSKYVDDMAFVYSCYSRSNNHTPAMLEMNSGMFRQGFPCMGSWLTYGLGSENQNLPAFVVMHKVKPRGQDPIWSSGFLPSTYQPTTLDASKPVPIDNLKRLNGISQEDQRDQLDLLRDLNQKHANARPGELDLEGRLESFELAYRMQMAAPEALDLSKETAATKQLYGFDQKRSLTFAEQCLTARRLVERGVRFVQIYGGEANNGDGSRPDVPWDGHNNIDSNHRQCGEVVDKPIAGLLSDLKARGMLNDTLVVWGGEFGRTSDSQGSKGRDHNPGAFTMWFAGGGIKGGSHYGRSDDFGYKAVENRVNVHDLHATILHLMGIDHERLTYRFNGRDFRLTDVEGRVLREILA